MLNERLQILVSRDQRRRLEAEARRRGTSVGSVVREAVDARLGAVSPEERLKALEGLRSMSGRFLPPDELDRISEGEPEDELEDVARPPRR